MSWWHDKGHPVWTLALVATVTSSALVLGYANANHSTPGK